MEWGRRPAWEIVGAEGGAWTGTLVLNNQKTRVRMLGQGKKDTWQWDAHTWLPGGGGIRYISQTYYHPSPENAFTNSS